MTIDKSQYGVNIDSFSIDIGKENKKVIKDVEFDKIELSSFQGDKTPGVGVVDKLYAPESIRGIPEQTFTQISPITGTTSISSGSGTINITGIGFQPKVIHFMAEGSYSNMSTSMGYAYDTGSGINNYVVYWYDSGGLVVFSGNNTTNCVLLNGGTAGNATVSAVNSDGFDLQYVSGAGNGTIIYTCYP